MPPIPNDEIQGAIAALDRWKQRERNAGSGRDRRLAVVHLALRNLQRRGWTRGGPKDRARKTASRRHAEAVAGLVPMPGGGAQVDLACDAADHSEERLETVEEAADVARVARVRLPPSDPSRSRAENDAEAGLALVELLEAGPGMATVATRHLTLDEARALATALMEAHERADPPPRAATLLLAALLTGRRVATLLAAPSTPPEAGFAWWHRAHGALALAFAPNVTAAPRRPNGGFAIRPPGPVAAALGRVLDDAPNPDDVERDARTWTWLRDHAGQGRTARLSRIEGALGAAFATRSVDSSLTALLTGADLRTHPQVYYLQTDAAALDRAYRETVAAWFGITRLDAMMVRTGRR